MFCHNVEGLARNDCSRRCVWLPASESTEHASVTRKFRVFPTTFIDYLTTLWCAWCGQSRIMSPYKTRSNVSTRILCNPSSPGSRTHTHFHILGMKDGTVFFPSWRTSSSPPSLPVSHREKDRKRVVTTDLCATVSSIASLLLFLSLSFCPCSIHVSSASCVAMQNRSRRYLERYRRIVFSRIVVHRRCIKIKRKNKNKRPRVHERARHRKRKSHRGMVIVASNAAYRES